MNNYLDTDKASVPFWGFIALIVAIDVYHKKNIVETKILCILWMFNFINIFVIF